MTLVALMGPALLAAMGGEDRRGLPDAMDDACFSLSAPPQEMSTMSRACESTSLGDASAESILLSAIESARNMSCLGMHGGDWALVIAGICGFFSTEIVGGTSFLLVGSNLVVVVVVVSSSSSSNRKEAVAEEQLVSRADGGTSSFIALSKSTFMVTNR